MRYRGSEAIDLDRQETADARYAPEARERRPFLVVEGGHLDADARSGVSPEFVSRARLVVVAVVVLCALGALRVALTAGTVTLMSDNLELSSRIEEASALNDELHAERSLLSSSSRIRSIATESYGMVSTLTGTSSGAEEAPEGTSADAAQDAD